MSTSGAKGLITKLFTVETTLLTQLCCVLLTIPSDTIGTYIWTRSFLFCNVRIRNFPHLCGVDSLSCQYICMYSYVKVLLDTRKTSFIFTLSLNASTQYFTRKKLWNNNYNSCNIVRCNWTPGDLTSTSTLVNNFCISCITNRLPAVILNQK